MKWKQYVLLATVFLVPWQAVWIIQNNASQYLRLELFASDILLLITAILFLPTLLAFIRRYHKPLTIAFIYFLVVSALTPAPLVAYLTLARLILLLGFMVVLRAHAKRTLLLITIAASAVGQGLLACWQFATQHVVASTILGVSEHLPSIAGDIVVETPTERWLRAYGTFPHPNILGAFLVIGLLAVIELYFHVYERFQTWWNKYGAGNKHVWREAEVRRTGGHLMLLLVALVALLAGLFVTFSRAALLAFATAFVAYLAMKISQNRIRGTMLGLKIVLIIAAVFWIGQTLYPGLWDARVSGTGRLEEKSVEDRTVGYVLAARDFAAHPLLGTGLGEATLIEAQVTPGHDVTWYQPVHNVFVLIVLEIGIVGVGLMLYLFWRHVKRFPNYLYDNASPLGVALAIVLVVLGMFDHFLFSLQVGLLISSLGIVLMSQTA